MNVQEWAALYTRLGEHPIPILPNTKKPFTDGWESKDFKPEDFDPNGNIGLRGGPFRGMLDCDLPLDDPARFHRSASPTTNGR